MKNNWKEIRSFDFAGGKLTSAANKLQPEHKAI